jgi:hypothetical protein
LGSSPFARHYSGSRGFFPFLRVLRCFSSPACSLLPYGFRQGYARITTRGFPHSEIPGSKVGQHLPGAYRSRPRPSSALGAKASTVCPCSLDQKEHVLMSLWSFQGARGLVPAVQEDHKEERSLKTQQRAPPSSSPSAEPVAPRGRTARGGTEGRTAKAAGLQRRGRHCSRRTLAWTAEAITSAEPVAPKGVPREAETSNERLSEPSAPISLERR